MTRVPLLRAILFAVTVAALLRADLSGQRPRSDRPRTAQEALARLDQLAGKPVAERQSAVAGLGDFAAPEITERLLAELAAADTPDWQRTVIQAIGKREREGVLEPLMELLDLSGTGNTTVMYAAGKAIGMQGLPGIKRLGEILDTALDSRQYSLRNAALQGLALSKLPEARAMMVRAVDSGDDMTALAALRYVARVNDDPALTAARLQAADSKTETLAAEAIKQLAAHDHARTLELALKLSARASASRQPQTHRILVEVLAKNLGPGTYEPVLVHAAAAGALQAAQKNVLAEAHRNEGFVRWLLAKGLERESTTERAIAVRLLAKAEGGAITKEILPLARAKEPVLAHAAIRALAERGGQEAIDGLFRLLRVRVPGLQVEALMGLHKLLQASPEWPEQLEKLMTNREPGVRALALDLLAELEVDSVLQKVYRDLSHKSWPVRAAALDYLRRVRRVESIPKLIARLGRETGRLEDDLLDTLQSLTNRRFWDTRRWRKWWKENQEGFQLPPVAQAPKSDPKKARPGGNTVSYYNIPLISDRVQFVLDISGSMAGKLGTGGNRTKLDEAKRQLHRVLEGIGPEVRFNMVFFHSIEEAWGKRLASANENNKDSAREAVKGLRPTGSTNVHDAMQLAFNDPDVDTIYLLTDGQPSAGPITDQNELADEIARWNRARRIRIHCVSVGTKSALLERLAKESGGEFVHVR